MIGWRRPISRRAWPSSTRPNQATCIGSRQATAWRSRTSFAALRRAPLRSRRWARGLESASAPPSTRPSRRSVRTPISALSSCARRSRLPRKSPDLALRPALARVLDRLDRADAQDVFSAIAAANPGGLGRAPRHDVNAPAAATLREAMAEAADRDRIARQYVTTYEDVFSLGLPALAAARRRRSEARWSTLAVYLTFLAAMPDTHIVRKFDAADRRGGPSRGGGLARRIRGGSRSGRDRRRLVALGRGAEITRDQPRHKRGSHRGDLIRLESLGHPRREIPAAILPLRANDA